MSHSPDEVNTCPILGHLYSSVLTMRCPHREGYTVVASVWRDTDDGDTVTLWSDEAQFGPFDDLDYIAKRVGHLSEFAAAVLTAHELRS